MWQKSKLTKGNKVGPMGKDKERQRKERTQCMQAVNKHQREQTVWAWGGKKEVIILHLSSALLSGSSKVFNFKMVMGELMEGQERQEENSC